RPTIRESKAPAASGGRGSALIKAARRSERRELNLTQTLDANRGRCLRRNPKPSSCGDFFEADARTRTGDPFITSEVLYQLSYVGETSRLAGLRRTVTPSRAVCQERVSS